MTKIQFALRPREHSAMQSERVVMKYDKWVVDMLVKQNH